MVLNDDTTTNNYFNKNFIDFIQSFKKKKNYNINKINDLLLLHFIYWEFQRNKNRSDSNYFC